MKTLSIENGVQILPETDFEAQYLKSIFLLQEKRKVVLRGAPTAVISLDIVADLED